jgi:hypothetical protein
LKELNFKQKKVNEMETNKKENEIETNKKEIELKAKKSKPLIIVFIAIIVLFLLFCGGALSVTLSDGGMMGYGWTSGISWMWIPALLFLTLSILLGWAIFGKKKL